MNSHRSNELWLGGDPQGKWSNYYELLGLPRGFRDTVVIARVADQLMKRIRIAAKQDTDVDRLRVIAKSVLDAKSCLTDPVKKELYDSELQTQQDADPAAENASPNSHIVGAEKDIPVAIPVGSPSSNTDTSKDVNSRPFQASERSSINRITRRKSGVWLKLGTIAVGAGFFAALAFLSKRYLLDEKLSVWGPPTQVTSDATADPTADSPATDSSRAELVDTREEAANNQEASAGTHTTVTGPSNDLEANAQTSSSGASEAAPAGREPVPLTHAEAEALSEALKAAKRSLSLREFTSAAKSLDEARAIARHPRHKELVEGLQELHHYAQEFWAGMDEAWSSLTAGMELQVRNTLVNVVDVGSDNIVVRVVGQNRRYQRDKLPSGLQKAIIENWLNPSAVSSDLIRGAFYATQDPPDVQAARQYWKSAQQRGADAEKLSATLTDSYAVEDLVNGSHD